MHVASLGLSSRPVASIIIIVINQERRSTMDKLKAFFKSKTAWATIGILAGAFAGPAGTAISGAAQTIACTLQTCV